MNRRYFPYFLLLVTLIISCQAHPEKKEKEMTSNIKLEIATLAGGCFWCMEPPFDKQEGVIKTIPGYAGGHIKNPTYEQVSEGGSGHLEVMQVHFNPEIVSYNKILDIFWMNIDPTDGGGQFVDRGSQYKTAIFYHNEVQKKLAEESLKQLSESKKFDGEIKTELLPLTEFYPAEDYHQDYYQKNPTRYHFYRTNSGRDQFIENKWGPKK